MDRSRSLLPFGEVTERLRLTGRAYVGVCSIPLAKIIGSVDRVCEFDRDFRPRRHDSEARMPNVIDRIAVGRARSARP